MGEVRPEGNATRPTWTPDGKRIAYGSTRDKENGIFWQQTGGAWPVWTSGGRELL